MQRNLDRIIRLMRLFKDKNRSGRAVPSCLLSPKTSQKNAKMLSLCRATDVLELKLTQAKTRSQKLVAPTQQLFLDRWDSQLKRLIEAFAEAIVFEELCVK